MTHEQLANILKALGHPVRLSVFRRLLALCQSCQPMPDEDGSSCVSALGEGLGVAASTLSHHIKELRVAGLVLMERDGQHMLCCINPEALAALRELFQLPDTRASEPVCCLPTPLSQQNENNSSE